MLILVCLAPTQFAETAGWAARPSKASFLPCNRDQQFKYLHSNKLLIKINMIKVCSSEKLIFKNEIRKKINFIIKHFKL